MSYTLDDLEAAEAAVAPPPDEQVITPAPVPVEAVPPPPADGGYTLTDLEAAEASAPALSGGVPSPGLGGVAEYEPPPGPIEGALLATGDTVGGALSGARDVVAPVVEGAVSSPVGQAIGNVLGAPIPGSENLPLPPPTALGGSVTPEGAGGAGQQVTKRIGAAADELASGDVPGAAMEIASIAGDPYTASMEAAGNRAAAGLPADPSLEEIVADPSQLVAAPAGGVAKPGEMGETLIGTTLNEFAQANPGLTGTALYEAWLDSNPEQVSAIPPPQLSNPLDVAGGGNPLERAANIAGAIPDALGGWLQSGQEGTLPPFVRGMIVQTLGDPAMLVPPAVGETLGGAALRQVGKIPGIGKLTALAPTEATRLAQEENLQALAEANRALQAQQAVPPPGAPPAAAATIPPPGSGVVPPGPGTVPTSGNGRQAPAAPAAAPPSVGQPPPVPAPNGRPLLPGQNWNDPNRGQGVRRFDDPVDPITGQSARLVGRAGTRDIRVLDDGYAIYEGNRLITKGIQSERAARNEARALAEPAALMEGVSAPLSGTPLQTQEMTTLANSLRRHLTRAGLDDTNLGIVPRIGDILTPDDVRQLASRGFSPESAAGMHRASERLIVLALEHADNATFGQARRMGMTLDHEIVHALRAQLLFEDHEWQTLLRTAREMKIDDPNTGFMADAYRTLTGEDLDGEMVAHLYEAYRMGRLTADHPAIGLLERIRVFLEGLGLALRDTFPEAKTIMDNIENGTIGRRAQEPRPPITPRTAGTEPDFSVVDFPTYHGTIETGLDVLKAEIPPERRQFPYASARMGVFGSPDLAEAQAWATRNRPIGYSGRQGEAYEISQQLNNAYDMPQREMGKFYESTAAAVEAAAKFKQKLIADGHDGIVVWRNRPMVESDGTVRPRNQSQIEEVIYFGDVDAEWVAGPGFVEDARRAHKARKQDLSVPAVRGVIPEPENPVSQPDLARNPDGTVSNGRAFMDPVIRQVLNDTPGPGSVVVQKTLDDLFTEIDTKHGGILSKNMEQGGKFNKIDPDTGERYNLRLWDAETLNAGLGQNWQELLWYENGAEMMDATINVPPTEKNAFYNTVAATSQNMKPGRNWKLALSTFAEKAQGKAIRTVSLAPEKVADGFANTHHDTPKFYNFANTPKYLTGMIDTPPGPTLDLQFARSIGLMDNASLDGRVYDALAEWVGRVRDEVNGGNAALGAPPLQTWNIQSAMWVLQRKTAGVTDIGDSFSQHIPATIEQIKALGIPLGPGDTITMETFRDPRMVTHFGETADFVRNQPISQFNPARTRIPEVVSAYQTRDGLMATPNPKSPLGNSMWDQKIPGSNQSRRTSFTTGVRTPLLRGIGQRLVPEIHKAITGTAITGRAISHDVMSTATDVFETMMLIPRGGSDAAGKRIVADHPFMGALLAKTFDLPSAKTRRYQDVVPGDPRPANGYRAFIELPPGERLSEEALQRISERAGVDLVAEHHRTGGVELLTQNDPLVTPDRDALTQAILDEYPLGRRIGVDGQHVSYNEVTGADYDRIKADLIAEHRYSRQLQSGPGQRRAQAAIDAIARAEHVAADLAAEWRRTSARWDAAHSDAVSPAARDALNALREAERNQRLQYSVRAAFGNRSRAQPVVTQTLQTTPDPQMRRGIILSEAAAKQVDAPIDGLIRFADGYRPSGMTMMDFADQTMADFNTWLGGLNADNSRKPWASQNTKWVQLDKRFNPDGTVDVGPMALAHGDTPVAREARASFLDETFAAGMERARVPSAKKAGVLTAWDSYTGGLRQAMLFNWLNAPRYVVQNMTTNTINIARRGGGIKPALSVFTDLPEWRRSFRNLKDPSSATTADAIMKAAGVGDRPNVRMNPKSYYDRTTTLPKWFSAPLRVIAPETLRFGASVPDQLGRLHVFSNAAWKGYGTLNNDLVGLITTTPEWKAMTIKPPDAKVRQVVRDFLEDHATLIDPNTGTPYTTMLRRPARHTPVWQADNLANTLRQRLAEDMPNPPDATQFRNAVERVRRITKNETRTIIDGANALADEALFPWRNTVADQQLGRVTLFHYWMTRQGGLYLSEAIRHPWIASAYGRAMEEMHTQAEELGQPEWMTGFFQFQRSAAGFSTWLSPFDLVQSLLTFADWQFGEDQSKFQDLTALGRGASVIPFFIHPFIQGVAYELGLLGPDYPAPPLTGTETFGSRAIDLLNLANAEGIGFMEPFNAMGIGVDSDGNKVPIPRKPLQELYARVGNALSTALEPITGLSPVEVAASVGSMDRNIQTIGEQQTRILHPDWDTHDVFVYVTDKMTDHASPEYQDWYAKSSSTPFQAGGDMPGPLAGIARMISPVQMASMPEQRALDTMEGLDPSGQIPVRPLPTSEREAEIYNESKYGASKTVEGRQLQSLHVEFGGLVDPALDTARDLASAIYGMRVEETLTVGGYDYTPEDIAAMENDERYDLGTQVLLDAGYTREDTDAAYAAEDQFLGANPDYAAFREYRELVYNHPGGPQGFVEETALTNPGFAQYVRSDMTDHLTGEIDYGKATFTDAYLASQGVRPSVYSSLVGNEPSTTPGGYPSLAGGDPTQPLLPLTTPTADIPLYAEASHPGQIAQYGAAYVDDVRVADPRIATIGPGTPLQMLGRDEKTGMVKVSVGGQIGYADPAMLEMVQPQGPAPSGPAPAPIAPGGGLGELAGNVMSAVGAGKDALGSVVGSMLGAPGTESKPAATSLGVAPGSYDVVPAVDGLGVQSTATGSDRTWMEFMLDGVAKVTTDYKGPPTADMTYQLGHGADSTNHAAYDISTEDGASYGKPIKSPVSGRVVCAGYGAGTGEALGSPQCTYAQGTTLGNPDGTPAAHDVVIEVGRDENGNPIQLSFSHIGKSDLKPGQTVAVGDVLGTVGDTTGGPHTHVEGWVGDPAAGYTLVDPQHVVGGYYGQVDSVMTAQPVTTPRPDGALPLPTLDWLGGITGQYDEGTTPADRNLNPSQLNSYGDTMGTAANPGDHYGSLPTAGGDWSVLDQFNTTYQTVPAQVTTDTGLEAPPPDLIKALNAMESGYGQINAPDGGVRTDVRDKPLVGFVGVFKDAADSWGVDFAQMAADPNYAIYGMATGLARIGSWDAAQYDPAATGTVLENYGWDGVMAIYYSGQPFLDAPQPADDTTTVRQYVENINAMRQQVV